jgi:radical SAM protein with 4Fe4S-binding SPASM domain
VNLLEILRQYKRYGQRIPRNLQSVRHLNSPVDNEELSRTQYVDGKVVLESLPPVVTFALTTFCNNRKPCLICDRHLRHPSGERATSSEVIAAVAPIMKTALHLLLHCGGEAMFSKHFDDVISMVNPPTRVHFATNAMLMHKRRVDKMLEKDIVGGIVVSLDAATPETYRIMRPSSSFKAVTKNIAYFTERMRALGRGDSAIFLNMTICEANLADVPKLPDLASQLGARRVEYNHLNEGLSYTVKTVDGWDWVYHDQARFKDKALHDRLVHEAYDRAKEKGIEMAFVGKPFLEDELSTGEEELAEDLLSDIPFASDKPWFCPRHKLYGPRVQPCLKPWREIVIQPDGDLRMCYFHCQSEWTIGNILERDFMEIWNSEEMIEQREQFLAKSVSNRCAQSAPCVHRQRT